MAKLQPLFRRVLRHGFDDLPREIRAMHDVRGILRSEGRCSVVRGSGLLSRLIATLARVPRAGTDIPISVEMRRDGMREVWRRNFNGSKVKTVLCRDARGGCVRERYGPLSTVMVLDAEAGGLGMRIVDEYVFGVRLPRFLRLRIAAREVVEDGRFTFEVSIALPVGGRLLRYRGWLEPVEAVEPKPTRRERRRQRREQKRSKAPALPPAEPAHETPEPCAVAIETIAPPPPKAAAQPHAEPAPPSRSLLVPKQSGAKPTTEVRRG